MIQFNCLVLVATRYSNTLNYQTLRRNYFNPWFNIKIISTWMGKKYDHDLINNMHTNMTRKSKCIRVLVMTKKGKYIKVLVYVNCPFNTYHQFRTYLKCRCIFQILFEMSFHFSRFDQTFKLKQIFKKDSLNMK